MKAYNLETLLNGIPFFSKPPRGSLPSSFRSVQKRSDSYISLAAKVAVCALIGTNLVQLLLLSTQSGIPCESDIKQTAAKLLTDSVDMHSPELLRRGLPEVVRQVIGVATPFPGRQMAGLINSLHPKYSEAELLTQALQSAADMHSPELLMTDLPLVVRQAIGAPMPFPDRHFAVFIIFSWNFPLFWSSLQTYMAAGWGKRVIILDNSADRRILHDPLVNQLVGEVIPTRVQLTFSQCQNYIADISTERNYTYFFWGHADVALQSSSTKQTFADEVVNCMDQIDAEKPDWGITYFHYDWFSATSRAVARDVRYDTFITVYMSDCDYYPRVRQQGFKTLDAASICKVVPSVHDMQSHMDLPLDDYSKTKEALEGIKISQWDRNSWKTKAWSLGEQVGWELWEHTTHQYFRYKWGLEREREATPHTCDIETENVDGSKALRQEPFETLDKLYTPLTRTSAKDLEDTPGREPSTADERRLKMF